MAQNLVLRDVPDLAEMSSRIARRDISSLEVVEAVLRNIEAINPLLNAYITVSADEARAAAARADREIASGTHRGPLHGVPVSVKDLFWTEGVRTTAGSRVLADFVPAEDATVVRRLKEAGAVLVGKTNMMEFAYATAHPDYGPTKNPWDLTRTALGSSGGSGAAVAAGMDFGSIGSDTGGSVRVPASFCGAVGLKPTYGRVSRYGMIPLSWTMDHAGPFGRSVRDVAILLRAIAGPDPKDPTAAGIDVPDYIGALDEGLDGLSIGLVTTFMDAKTDPEVRAAVRRAVDVLADAGGRAREIAIPELDGDAIAAYMPILFAEAAHCHREWIESRPGDYSDGALERLLAGRNVTAVAYFEAGDARDRIRGRVRQIQQDVDLLVMPTMPMVALPLEDTSVEVSQGEQVLKTIIRMTSPFDLTGFPALTVPCGFSDSGLPIGLQIVGRHFEEAMVLRAGHAFQARTDWHRRKPTHSASSVP